MERSVAAGFVLDALREQLDADGTELDDVDESTPLLGADAPIDSLGLVNVIVDIEQRMLDDHGVVITIVDEKAMSQRNSPFRTVGTLSDYIHASIEIS
ncbi:MAG: hypothetical protein HKN41_05065 [Ilumatobacter sp.]|nr:hypothetical protein [Ilumatobacter sp.]